MGKTIIKLEDKDTALVFTEDGINLYIPKKLQNNDQVSTQALTMIAIAKLTSDSDGEFSAIISKTLNTMFEEINDCTEE